MGYLKVGYPGGRVSRVGYLGVGYLGGRISRGLGIWGYGIGVGYPGGRYLGVGYLASRVSRGRYTLPYSRDESNWNAFL